MQLSFKIVIGVDNAPKNKKIGATSGGFAKGDPRINRAGRPPKRNGSRIRGKYGITEADYAEMLERQNGVCAVCGRPETMAQRRGNGKEKIKGSLAVDHNHETGKIRGLLCWKCNVGIVKQLDNRELTKNAAKYLGITIQYPDERTAE